MTSGGVEPTSVLVYGLGVTNLAVARALVEHGLAPVLADDFADDAKRAVASELGVSIASPSSDEERTQLLTKVEAWIPSPGLAESHPMFEIAAICGVPAMSEFDLAQRWDDRPLWSITGTNGKTTVTMMATEIARCSGKQAVAVGNTELPLVSAISDPDIDIFVVESSSFRLAQTHRFVPQVATWLNFAPDHLDVHASLERYELSKARSWDDLTSRCVAVANAEDPVVARHIGRGDATFVTFGLAPSSARHGIGHYTVVDGWLVTPHGEQIIESCNLSRALPHDIANALAAAATAIEGGATIEGTRTALRKFVGLPHRMERIADSAGISWWDDSKATAPHAVIAAVSGFASVILIAGGRNKGLDLSALADVAPHVRAVVGIGEAGPEVVEAFPESITTLANSMADAVEAAARLAQSGDAVILSPGCASFDWYDNYGQRGDDFVTKVRDYLEQDHGE